VNPKTGNLVAAQMVTPEVDQIVVTSKFGQIIKLPIKNIPKLGRATQGVILMKTGILVAAQMVTPDVDQIVVTSKFGQVIKLPIKNIPKLGRATQGVILMRFTDKTDGVAGVATLYKNGDEEEEKPST